MASIPVIVKHQGKRHELELDPSGTGEIFKFQLYSLTGVEPERQKILVKGGQLKDDTDLSTLNVKPGHTFMMMGTPAAGTGAVDSLAPPKEPVRFMEDMTEAEAARVEGATPAGLQNLGNTCYMNSTLQTLRLVPELQDELAKYKPGPGNDLGGASSSSGLGDLSSFGLGGLGSSVDLTSALRDLYKQMSETQEGFPPLMFLNALRNAFPQFAQKAKSGNGYAQQDAEEAWSQIISQLRLKLKTKDIAPTNSADDSASQTKSEISFIDKYLAGKFESLLECDEAAAKEAGEEAVKGEDVFLKLDCHISGQTNHLRDGIHSGLEEKIEKNSEILGRNSTYTKKSRVARFPKYLTVHFVRFFWKREAQKKAKIMRKVTFPHELDVVEFCTDELKKTLIPVRDRIREIRKDEEDVERARKRRKRVKQGEDYDKDDKDRELKAKGPSDEKALAKEKKSDVKEAPKAGASKADGDTEMADAVYKTDAEIDAEKAAAILDAKKQLLEMVNNQTTAGDEGANHTGLYELRGLVTHRGASADSGHYTSYVKKEGPKDPKTGKRGEEDGSWWWFNDDKVSDVPSEKIDSLSGGGESDSALILLYRAVSLPKVEDA
ncbi:MAG: hypothetical protein M4579_001554 [Chaenotheca gracillima]|nr:MAG: hypothetical protein M4579_001554 [Chaenotheca gracillima]